MTDRSYTNPRTGEVVETEPRPFDQILRELGEGSTLPVIAAAILAPLRDRHRLCECAYCDDKGSHVCA